MNPATDIIRRVFPSYSQPSMAASKSSSHSACQSPNPQPKTSLGGDSAQINRLRETIFKLNMEIAACRGARQRLEATVAHYENMENYYLTELEIRKQRADCLEAQLALVLDEFPSHRQLKLPQQSDDCGNCCQMERMLAKLAQQLNLKNKLLLQLDASYKQTMDRVADCLREYKTKKNTKTISSAAKSDYEDNKQNNCEDKATAETQTTATKNEEVRPFTERNDQENTKMYKKSKVILKRVMPQRSAQKPLTVTNQR